MTAIPHGHTAMWVVVLGGVVLVSLACHLLKPSSHRQSIHRHHREKGWRE